MQQCNVLRQVFRWIHPSKAAPIHIKGQVPLRDKRQYSPAYLSTAEELQDGGVSEGTHAFDGVLGC
jgi:hypothetical protein